MIKRYAAQWISGILTVVATVFVTPQSALLIHKPEVPTELLNRKK
ncbi:AgrD family cyclic lactone autoinducer peptide [Paenibacillus flagellatus]|nr:cyclic lactone autoinducer peptide [Paenibacillus flagellatus]